MQIVHVLRLALLAGAMVVTSGAVELPRMFSDHGVLQQGESVPVWGWGSPGETIRVAFGDQKVTGKADQGGEWRLELKNLEANATGQKLTVTGDMSGTVEVQDLLVGEVWMASGQSNMQWSLAQIGRPKEELAAIDFPGMRMFLTHQATAVTPQRKVGGSWLVATPESVAEFSAVGYYFGLKLHQELGVPVGVIRTAWNGKPAEAFTSREGLLTKPEGKLLVDALDEEMKVFDAGYAKAKADYEVAWAAWETMAAPMIESNKTAKTKQRVPRRPNPPASPAMEPDMAASIYNGMIHPWVGYALRGAIWYQGESNASRAKQYETIFPQLIVDWRKHWKKEFPFYFVQLANFKEPSKEPGIPDEWAELQNAQRLTLSLPKTGMAVINDIGMADNIHPTNKLDVGNRLARWALVKDYGKSGIVICGPLYQSAKVEGGAVRIKLEHAGGLKSRDGGPLKRFEIAGADHQWFWADAIIEGETVVVSSKEVPQPVVVRYAWAANPEGANLVNGEGLPASLFQTEKWHAAESHPTLIKSFFRDNGQNGVYLAASEDGIAFTPLNDDQPVMKPGPWDQQNLTRDPSIVFHEGTFHIVWTTGWEGDCFGYAESKDLIHWSEPVRVEPFKGKQSPKNVWAPEICWDPKQQEFMIFWSSVVPPAGQRIFVTRTKDGKGFSEAKLFHQRDYEVIDGHLLLDEAEQRWLLTYKNENPTKEGGKNIRIATAPQDLSNPFVDLLDQAIVGADTPIQGDKGEKSMGEGPSLVKLKDTYHLYWDSPYLRRYCLATSTDLKTWTDRTSELKVPSGTRHGTVFRAPRAAVGWPGFGSAPKP